MTELSPLLYLLLIIMLCAVTVTDIRSRRIPNLFSLGGMCAGLISWGFLDGWPGLLHSVLGILVGGALFFPFYLLRGMGAGDVKLMAAVGAFLGPMHAFNAGLVVAIVGGVIAAIAAIRSGRLGEALRDSIAILSRDKARKTLDNASRSESIPYGLAISSGVLLYLVLVHYG